MVSTCFIYSALYIIIQFIQSFPSNSNDEADEADLAYGDQMGTFDNIIYIYMY